MVRIYFAVCFDKPFESLDGWADKECFPDIEELQGTTESTPRSDSGWSYHDAPTSGVSAQYQVRRGEQVCLKVAVSYVSLAKAKESLETECNHLVFDKVRRDAHEVGIQWPGKIEIKGVADAQNIKCSTD